MATAKKQKSNKGIPRRARSVGRAARRNRYWAKCTCSYCPGANGKTVVFKSPGRKVLHVEAKHDYFPAQRKVISKGRGPLDIL
ncbi:hypothetical protein LCGC14_1660520, partial [marine sediment metagenome]